MSEIALALLASAMAQLLCARDIELSSEIVCWIILPAAVHVMKLRRDNTGIKFTALIKQKSGLRHPPPLRSLLLALAVAAACSYRSQERVIALYPFLTPAFVFRGILPSSSQSNDLRFHLPSALTSTWGCVFLAALCSLALVVSNGTPLTGLALCAIVVALLCIGYLAIATDPARQGDPEKNANSNFGIKEQGYSTIGVDVEAVTLPWALCMLPALGVSMVVRSVMLGQPNGPLLHALVVGIVKAVAWFFTLRATHDSSVGIVSTIGTFAMAATTNPFSQPSLVCGAFTLVASLCSLGQTIHWTPSQNKSKAILWCLAVIPAVPFMASCVGLHGAAALFPRESHPIEALVQIGERRFNSLLKRQSRSYAAAESEYRRRYRVEPPPHFEAWYKYAVAHNAPIIDDYDMIYENMEPFLKMSGQEVVDAIQKVQDEEERADMWKCTFTKHNGTTECVHESRDYDGNMRSMLARMLTNMTDVLPDMLFLSNGLDEPRVILENPENPDRILISHMDLNPVAQDVTSNCPKGSSAVKSLLKQASNFGVQDHGIPFVADAVSEKDLCAHPEYGYMHGLLMRPVTFVLLEGRVPVLGMADMSTMGDVLIPSSSYGSEAFAYDDGQDMDWERKRNNLFWAGSTTGGYGFSDDWKKFHRQRFVAQAENLEGAPKQHWYLTSQNGVQRRITSPPVNNTRYDVRFTSVFSCSDEVCAEEIKYFGNHSRTDRNAAFRSKLVFDLDGNGPSGRFYQLLSSRSAVLKQTILREWHDERLIPWVHYVPVSQGLADLPEIVEWLTGTQEGLANAKKIADRGRDWVFKGMRQEDRDVYLYRVMIELARVQDPTRKAI